MIPGPKMAILRLLQTDLAVGGVYAAGIDPTLVQFELAPVSAGSDWLVWQRSGVRDHDTHDVRAVNMMNDYVITGGRFCCNVQSIQV